MAEIPKVKAIAISNAAMGSPFSVSGLEFQLPGYVDTGRLSDYCQAPFLLVRKRSFSIKVNGFANSDEEHKTNKALSLGAKQVSCFINWKAVWLDFLTGSEIREWVE